MVESSTRWVTYLARKCASASKFGSTGTGNGNMGHKAASMLPLFKYFGNKCFLVDLDVSVRHRPTCVCCTRSDTNVDSILSPYPLLTGWRFEMCKDGARLPGPDLVLWCLGVNGCLPQCPRAGRTYFSWPGKDGNTTKHVSPWLR